MLQAAVMGVVEGLTEFLPISSSGHLILVPAVSGWPDQGFVTDMITNVGTLLAVIVYFCRDVIAMLRDATRQRGVRLGVDLQQACAHHSDGAADACAATRCATGKIRPLRQRRQAGVAPLHIVFGVITNQASRAADAGHDVVAGVDAEAALDAVDLQAIANVDAGGADEIGRAHV